MKICLNCQEKINGAGWECPACGHAPESHNGYLAFAPELAESEDEYSADFFELLMQLEEGHFWFEARNRLLVWALRRYFPKARHVLEVGCGTGFVLSGLSRAFPSMALAGCDLFTEGLAFAARRVPGADLFQVDARHMPFRDEFDVTGAFDVIEHIEEDEAVLQQLFAAIKPGGGLMLTVPQHRFLWTFVDEYAHHKRRYNRAELRRKVQSAGFEVLYVTSFVSLLLPVMAASRFKHYDEATFDVLEEFSVNPVVNSFLQRVMVLEFNLLKRGITFPAGGSLLMIGRKPL